MSVVWTPLVINLGSLQSNQASFRNEKMRPFSKQSKNWKTFQNSNDAYITRIKNARTEKLNGMHGSYIQTQEAREMATMALVALTVIWLAERNNIQNQ